MSAAANGQAGVAGLDADFVRLAALLGSGGPVPSVDDMLVERDKDGRPSPRPISTGKTIPGHTVMVRPLTYRDSLKYPSGLKDKTVVDWTLPEKAQLLAENLEDPGLHARWRTEEPDEDSENHRRFAEWLAKSLGWAWIDELCMCVLRGSHVKTRARFEEKKSPRRRRRSDAGSSSATSTDRDTRTPASEASTT